MESFVSSLGTAVLFLLLPFLAYVMGSVPWGLIVTWIFTSEDIRKSGSGNIGATNVRRRAGTWAGLLTLAGDAAKGAVPVYLAVQIAGSGSVWSETYLSVVAVSAFAGHLYPIFMKGKGGGKGVATAGGCFLVISPFSLFAAVLVFILFVCMSSRVSAGSLSGSVILPLAVWKATGSGILTACALVTAAGIIFRHRENIGRLCAGTEPRV
ncbi:MAG: glycerol-3-phosphate 1-O-acyltransferase PlsY [Desulfobacterales bacterium]